MELIVEQEFCCIIEKRCQFSSELTLEVYRTHAQVGYNKNNKLH